MNFPDRLAISERCIVVGDVAVFGVDSDHGNIRVGACGRWCDWEVVNRATNPAERGDEGLCKSCVEAARWEAGNIMLLGIVGVLLVAT